MPKILVVEDNPDIREMLVALLQRKRYEMFEASDGRQAVELARTERPDVILMDMSLPVMDGWEATRQIKAAPETRHIAVIALTAHAFSEDQDKTVLAGCDDYEAKPIDFPRLYEKIQRYAQR